MTKWVTFYGKNYLRYVQAEITEILPEIKKRILMIEHVKKEPRRKSIALVIESSIMHIPWLKNREAFKEVVIY